MSDWTPISQARQTTARTNDKKIKTIRYAFPPPHVPLQPGDEAPPLLLPECMPYWHVPGREQHKDSQLSQKEWETQELKSSANHRDNEKLFWEDEKQHRSVLIHKFSSLGPTGGSANEILLYYVKFQTLVASWMDHGAPREKGLWYWIRTLDFLTAIKPYYPAWVARMKAKPVDSNYQNVPTLEQLMQDLNRAMLEAGEAIDENINRQINTIRPEKHRDALEDIRKKEEKYRRKTKKLLRQNEERASRKKPGGSAPGVSKRKKTKAGSEMDESMLEAREEGRRSAKKESIQSPTVLKGQGNQSFGNRSPLSITQAGPTSSNKPSTLTATDPNLSSAPSSSNRGQHLHSKTFTASAQSSNSLSVLPSIEEADEDVVMTGTTDLTAANLQMMNNAAMSRPVTEYTDAEWAERTIGWTRASTVSTNGLFREPKKRETTEEIMGGSLYREMFDVRMEAISEVVEAISEVGEEGGGGETSET